MSKDRVFIFDTTLRDGQQSPGAGLSFEDNLIYADHADRLNIDILEAGFPAASQTDFYIVKSISERMAERRSNMIVTGLCQLREEQFVKTMQALEPSLAIGKARVHTYVPVDPNLLKASLGNLSEQPQKIIDMVYTYISMATKQGYEVEFSPEGYSRMGDTFDYVTDLIRAAVSAGAKIINCPDTIGGACQLEGEFYFVNQMQKHAKIIKSEFPKTDVIWSSHCHNDMGLALDNSMQSVFNGPARQIECCINGVGERAGNASLEQCVMYIKQFGEFAPIKLYTGIDVSLLKPVSDFIASKMLPRQPHSPIVGENATRHTSGGHTNAILNNPMAYQPFDPKDVGSEVNFVFGPLSGGNHAKQIIEKYGYICADDEKVNISQAIKDYYKERRKGITDIELIHAYKFYRFPIKITEISYAKSTDAKSTLQINGRFFDKDSLEVTSHGENSALAALMKAVEVYYPEIMIEDYRSESCKGDSVDALSRSLITVRTKNKQTFKGVAEDSDIEVSALKAFVDAVNNAYVEEKHRIKE